MKREVTAFAPASVSNVSCGFDIMGFALRGAGDTVTARPCESPGVHIGSITGSSSALPLDAAGNTACPPVAALLARCAPGRGIELDIRKGVPVGGGIGSSAASAVAAVLAADALLGTRLTQAELLALAVEGEKIASGAVHVDNLAPSLMGGFVLVRGYDPIDVVSVAVAPGFWCAVVSPDVEIRTEDARKILPHSVPLRDVVRQTGNAAGLVAGLLTGDGALVGRSLVDVIAEPARRHLIPAYEAMRSAALGEGALGCGISGSGPSMYAIGSSEEGAGRAARAMERALRAAGHECTLIVSPVGAPGASVMT
ncbi:MAG TPA: homoserine kinase [Bacteroidota bacterium]|nr:homoserine kinase [Bacteroidota bacterium]